MDTVNVLVTSAGSGGYGSSIVKALVVSKVKLNIIVADMSQRMIMTSPIETKEILPRATDDCYIDELMSIIKKHSVHCMFTGSEQELIKVSECREEVKSTGVQLFINNDDTIKLCKNKLECNNTLKRLGFSPPKTVHIKSVSDVEKGGYREWFWPIVIKPYLESGASRNIFIANNEDELYLFSNYLLLKGIGIIAQEYIPYNDNEYTVGVTSLLDQPYVEGSIALRKFIEGLTVKTNSNDVVISSGITQGEFQDYAHIRSVCEQIAEEIGSTGPINIQLRIVRGIVKPFEINPRFSGTTSARAYNGYNEPEFYIRKYVLDDKNAKKSILTTKTGFVVKGLDERYYES